MSENLLNILRSIKQVLQTQIQDIKQDNAGEPFIVGSDTSYNVTDDIKTLLDNGICEFWFVEKDGSLRFAIGTRVVDIIKEYSNWSYKGRKVPRNIIPYFDIQRTEWRSFRIDDFIRCVEFTDKKALFD